MKKSTLLVILLAAVMIIPFSSFAQKKEKKNRKSKESKESEMVSKAPAFRNNTDTISYIIGADIARSFKTNEVSINYDMLNVGIQAGLWEADTVFTKEQIQSIMTAWNQEIMKAKQDKAQQESVVNRKKGAEFLAENKKKDSIVSLPSGLQYKIIKEGKGIPPSDSSMVEVEYTGKLIDGTVFDSSRDRGQPLEIAVNGVIPGWTEGLKLMKPGAIYMFYIPADLAYGDKKMRSIPAGSTLIFEVELLVVDNK